MLCCGSEHKLGFHHTGGRGSGGRQEGSSQQDSVQKAWDMIEEAGQHDLKIRHRDALNNDSSHRRARQ